MPSCRILLALFSVLASAGCKINYSHCMGYISLWLWSFALFIVTYFGSLCVHHLLLIFSCVAFIEIFILRPTHKLRSYFPISFDFLIFLSLQLFLHTFSIIHTCLLHLHNFIIQILFLFMINPIALCFLIVLLLEFIHHTRARWLTSCIVHWYLCYWAGIKLLYICKHVDNIIVSLSKSISYLFQYYFFNSSYSFSYISIYLREMFISNISLKKWSILPVSKSSLFFISAMISSGVAIVLMNFFFYFNICNATR